MAVEASIYAMVVEPGAFTAGHDLVDAAADQVNDVLPGVGPQCAPQLGKLVGRHGDPVLVGVTGVTEVGGVLAAEHQVTGIVAGVWYADPHPGATGTPEGALI